MGHQARQAHQEDVPTPRTDTQRGAFRRFKDELNAEYPDLVPSWHAFRDARSNRRAIEWLLDRRLIDEDAASQFLTAHPDPKLP
jgi:hypothetical protein